MFLTALLLTSLSVLAPQPAVVHDTTVGFAQSMASREARLMEGLTLAATFKPSLAPPLRITDTWRFGLDTAPMPLDQGSAMDGETRQVLALLMGLIVGFGIGHLVAHDRDGFILFLVIDIAIIVVGSVFHAAFGHGVYFGLGGLALLVSHVIQGLDAYAEAGGTRIVEWTRSKMVLVAEGGGGLRGVPLPTTRAFGFAF